MLCKCSGKYIDIYFILKITFMVIFSSNKDMKVIGIIGAGASGLCATRNAAASPHLEPIVWEQSEELGGTWRLSEEADVDKNGLPVHSSMYQNLK